MDATDWRRGVSWDYMKELVTPTIAAQWHKLMTDVSGCSKFGAQGGDLGSGITVSLGRMWERFSGYRTCVQRGSDSDLRHDLSGDRHNGFGVLVLPALQDDRATATGKLEQPQLLVEDLRSFFGKLRG